VLGFYHDQNRLFNRIGLLRFARNRFSASPRTTISQV